MSKVMNNWKKIFRIVTWVVSIVFPTCILLSIGLVDNPLMSSFIWFQCFVLIWLFYVIILLLESPVKNAKERLSKTQKSPVKRFKNWLSQSQHDSE